MQPLHQALKERPLLGPFSKTCDPNFIEAMGMGGMDFVILDLEHGPNDIVNLGPLIRSCESSSMYSVVRVLRNDQIGRALDLGAKAIQIPHISSASDARAATKAARFAPQGMRGVCRYVRAASHSSTDKAEYFAKANDITVIAQVEGKQGLANLDSILEVPGIDVIFLGVYDLSQSLGFTGQVDRPEVLAALEEVIAQCLIKGVPVGTFVESTATARQYQALGISYLCYAVDIGLLYEACRSVTHQVGLH